MWNAVSVKFAGVSSHFDRHLIAAAVLCNQADVFRGKSLISAETTNDLN